MKRRAETTIERTINIISQSIANQNENIEPHLPSTATMGRTIRIQFDILPPVPMENDVF